MKFNRIFLIIVALILAIQPPLAVQATENAGTYPPPLKGDGVALSTAIL
jgi:hypothetical protein